MVVKIRLVDRFVARDWQFGLSIRGAHFALGNLTLSEDGRGVIAVDPGPATARQLCRSKRGDRDELEFPHLQRGTDHRAPAAMPKMEKDWVVNGPSQGKALVRARAGRASELKKAD